MAKSECRLGVSDWEVKQRKFCSNGLFFSRQARFRVQRKMLAFIKCFTHLRYLSEVGKKSEWIANEELFAVGLKLNQRKKNDMDMASW